MGRYFAFWLCVFSVWLTGCETTPSGPKPPDIISTTLNGSTPYEIDKNELFRINIQVNNTESLPFIVDTGASISVLFESTADALKLAVDTSRTATVHGIVQSRTAPVINVANIKIGEINFDNIQMAILRDREGADPSAGIIGMDILNNYVLAFDQAAGQMSLLSPSEFQSSDYNKWSSIPLVKNPYMDESFGLNFMMMGLSGYNVPAVLDTGSAITIINWPAARNPALRRLRKRLRSDWELEGAVGTFQPQVLVKFNTIKSNAYTWADWDVLITELSPLNLILSNENPLMIAGADLLKDTSIIIDFPDDKLYIKPTRAHRKKRDRPMTGTRTKATTNAIGVFDGIER